MAFTDDDKIVIKFLRQNKHYGAKRFIPWDKVVVEKVYRRRVKDMSELRERIVAAWNELDQRIIDTAVTRLRACVGQSSGGHFEHKLWLAVSD